MKKVSCGEFHTLCLLTDGSVHSWGGTLHNKLGSKKDTRGMYMKDSNNPY